jgi:hypothetical protein
MLIGYARVSTAEQNLDLQTDDLNRAGCERLFTDKAGGARTDRPGLDQALAHLRKGDTLVVCKLDCFSTVACPRRMPGPAATCCALSILSSRSRSERNSPLGSCKAPPS